MQGDKQGTSARRVSLTRVASGTTLEVVFESDAVVRGMFSHYVKNKGRYCPGETSCKHCAARLERVWRGYAAVQLVDRKQGTLTPGVVELTESAELDLRHQVEPLQVWRLHRPIDNKGKVATLGATLAGRLPALPDKLVWLAPVDVIRWVYHAPEIELDQVNPVPSRLLVASVPLPGFHMPREEAPKPLTSEQREELRRRMRELGAPPTETKEGVQP